MRIVVEEGVLKVALETQERLWACKRYISVPLSQVATVNKGIPGPRLFDIRALGTNIPGVVKAGTYFTRGGKEFWYVPTGKQHYLTIELDEGSRYRRIVLGLDDVEDLVRLLGTTILDRDTVETLA